MEKEVINDLAKNLFCEDKKGNDTELNIEECKNEACDCDCSEEECCETCDCSEEENYLLTLDEGIYGENTQEYKDRYERVKNGEIFKDEYLGRIFRFNLEKRTKYLKKEDRYDYTLCLHMSIKLYKFKENFIENGVLVCEIPLSDITYKRDDIWEDWLNGLLDHERISGFNGFIGKLVKVKTRDIIDFDNDILQSRVDEIEFLDDYKTVGKILISGDKANTQCYWVKRLFRSWSKIKLQLTPLTKEEGFKYLTCLIDEFPLITGNEIANVIGQPLEGNFDKTIYEWSVKMDLFTKEGEKYSSYAFNIYDYKTYGDITMDTMYAYHIGGGVKIDGYKEDDALDYFIMYLYNEILKQRTQNVENQ